MSFNVVLLDRKAFPLLDNESTQGKGFRKSPVRFWLEAGQATQS